MNLSAKILANRVLRHRFLNLTVCMKLPSEYILKYRSLGPADSASLGGRWNCCYSVSPGDTDRDSTDPCLVLGT